MLTYSSIKIFACNSNRPLAESIAKKLGLPMGQAEVSHFADGETSLRIDESVRSADVYIIQSTSPPHVNDYLMELLIMTDAMRRASAGRITAVIPYFGYARQDRKARSRDPISAKLVANLITTAGVNRVLTMDLHCAQLQGFFDIPLDHLVGVPLLASYFRSRISDLSNFVAVSPDLGSVTRARSFAERLNIPIAIVDKRRQRANVSEVMNIIGEVRGKNIILVDDMIDTAGSITNAADAIKNMGALDVYACCTHALLSHPAAERIQKSAINELVVLNTTNIPAESRIDKIKIISVEDFFADSIDRIHKGGTVSELFK
ncbi:MAG: ribose-phosphate pyrophosphokinase [Clostridiales bacterium]|jgi:ribose-phosphate pyrophosphokinase|nr:ribose-phosphate pyrophosphokinase [Clostridiales bacterium]